MPLRLSPSAARRLMVAAQGLHCRSSTAAAKADALAAIRRVGALQIDTIHVVARSPYLALWSRLGEYEPRWLDELLAEGALFEYWSHAACFLPIEDYPLYRHRMLGGGLLHWLGGHPWLAEHRDDVERMLDLIRQRGAVRSADFERRDGRKSGWWDWKPEKRLLEALFIVGEVMVARRHNFQRIYDLRERVLPGWDDSQLPSADEARRALALRAARALGVATERWIAEYFHIRTPPLGSALEALADAGALLRCEVEGWSEPTYVHAGNAALAEATADGALGAELTTLLSPFDSLIWDRGRTRVVFGFDYALECYTPAAKRRYGYYTLPILRRGELIGRLDPKAHRRDGLFEVRALHLEPGIAVSDELVADLARALGDCARWHATPEVAIRASSPSELAGLLQRAFDKG